MTDRTGNAMSADYVGKRATVAWLNANAPSGTVVLNHSGIEYIRRQDGTWRGFNVWATFLLKEDDYGYQITQWGDPWDDLEWVDEE